MAEIKRWGRPDDRTVGAVGDIYTNTNTGEQFECVDTFEIRVHGSVITYYVWVPVGSGSGGAKIPTLPMVTTDDAGKLLQLNTTGDLVPTKAEQIAYKEGTLSDYIPVYLTQDEYDALVTSGKVNENAPYLIVDDLA